MTWPTTWATVPRWMALNGKSASWVKTTSRETAMTISGVTSGTSISELETPEPRPRQRDRPTASRTPSGVAMTMSRPASSRLWTSACVYWGSWKIDWVGSPHHHLIEKPCHTLRDLPALKRTGSR